MPTLTDYVKRMVEKAETLGEYEAVTSLTTTTIVSAAYATGVIDSEKYIRKWLWRPYSSVMAQTADRYRIVKTFASASGTFTHEGTNYADTTATSENFLVLEHKPSRFINAVQSALKRAMRRDVEIIPMSMGQRTWMNELDWVDSPSKVLRVSQNANPVISRNRYFEKWNKLQATGGTLAADFWTLSGSGATYARSTTQNRRGKYTAAITRAGTNCLLAQTPGLLYSGVSGEDMRSKDVTGVAAVWSAVASQVRVQVTDGITTSSSSYHTGGSGWEVLEVAHSVASTATTLTVQVSVESDNTVCYVDEAYLVFGDNDDAVKRDNWPISTVWDVYEQGAGTLAAMLEDRPVGAGQWVFETLRQYPTFDAARVTAGTADSDDNDAPLELIAVGAIARLYDSLANGKEAPAEYRGLAAQWEQRYAGLARNHIYDKAERGNTGFDIPMRVPSLMGR